MRPPSPLREASPAPPAAVRAPAPRAGPERETLTYLRQELLSDLERAHHDGAARGVALALKAGNLQPLRELPASQKHALLGTLEARMVGRSGRRPGPSVVVRLIGCLDLTPPELLHLQGRRPVLPPR